MTISPQASAQALGGQGRLAVSVEDVTGYYVENRVHDDVGNVEVTQTHSQASLLLRDGARVGVHYFIVPQLSIGGTLGFESRDVSRSQPDGAGSFNMDGNADSTFILHAKAGYLLPVSGRAGFWFRGGPGVRRSAEHPNPYDEYKITETHWILGLDVLFVVAPFPTFGIFAGPTADISVIGRHAEANLPGNPPADDFSHSGSYRRLGGGLGIMGMF